ncbi:MAG: hypothetical protein WB820_14810, partial [Rhodoplanes sp.]
QAFGSEQVHAKAGLEDLYLIDVDHLIEQIAMGKRVVPLAAAISDQHLSGGNTRRIDGRTSRVKTQIASFRQSPDGGLPRVPIHDSPIAAGG